MTDETKLYNFRLPIALMERVKAMADKHSLSVTAVVLTKLRTFADEGVQSNIIPLGPPASEVANDLVHALVELGEANEIIERQTKEIAKQKKALAVAHEVQLSPAKALAVLRGIPAMKSVVPTPDGTKLVAAVLPLTGTEFPARPVYLRGQDPTKAKGKR